MKVEIRGSGEVRVANGRGDGVGAVDLTHPQNDRVLDSSLQVLE